jgi:hypothetical protein
MDSSKTGAGFTMSLRTRPMVIGKFQEYVGDRSVVIQSKRLLEEMKVFIWKNGRAEAQQGYNDDLIMPFSIAMYLRDTAFKFKQQGIDLTRTALNNFSTGKNQYQGAYFSKGVDNPYSMNIKGHNEDLTWLTK